MRWFLEGGEKERCVEGEKMRLSGWIETAKYICESKETVVAQCNYCQEGETLLLLSRTRGAGPVQARYTSIRLSPSAHVRTGDRKKAMGP